MKLKSYTTAPLCAAAFYFLTLIYGWLTDGANLPSAWRLPLLGLAQTLACLLPAVVWLCCYRDFNARRLRFALPRAASLGTLVLLLVCLLLGSALLSLVGQRIGFDTVEITGISGAANPWLTLFTLCVLPAVCEEFLFRGVLLCAFEACGTRAAIVGASLLFAAAHMSLEKFATYFFCSVILCFAVYVSRSLLAAVLLHAVYNIASVYSGAYLSGVAAHLDSFALLFIVLLLLLLVLTIFALSSASRVYRVYADENLPSDYAPQRQRGVAKLRAGASVYFSLPFLLCALIFAAVVILRMR